jgi:hypothetical protein
MSEEVLFPCLLPAIFDKKDPPSSEKAGFFIQLGGF